MKLEITLIFYLIVGSSCNDVYIRKCCKANQQLNASFDGSCIDFDGAPGLDKYVYEVDNSDVDTNYIHLIRKGKKESHPIWWLPSEFTFLSANLSTTLRPDEVNISIKYYGLEGNTMCAPFERILLPFNDYVYLLEDGSLWVAGFEDGVSPEIMKFPSRAYCIDRISRIPTDHRKRISNLTAVDHSFAIFACPTQSEAGAAVRMCCHNRHYLEVEEDGTKRCEYSPDVPVTWPLKYVDENRAVTEKKKPFVILEGIPRCNNSYYLNNKSSTQKESFWIQPDGRVTVGDRHNVITDSYCIHFLNISGHFELNLRLCPYEEAEGSLINAIRSTNETALTDEQKAAKRREDLLYDILFVTGAFFLALTLVTYVLLLEKRLSLFDQILCSHVGALFVCYSTMAFVKFFRPVTWSCQLSGYIIQYTFISSTLWLNVMCWCIHRSFSGYTLSGRGAERLDQSRKFQRYSLYVWGITAIISFWTFLMDHTDIVENSIYRPQIGNESCWLEGREANLIYFYIPFTLIIAANLLMFTFTLRKIFEKMENKKSNGLNTENSKKYVGGNEVTSQSIRISLFVKLFLITGIAWIFEIVSWYFGGSYKFWFTTDVINALRGVFIFVLCCCKKKFLFRILKRPTTSSGQSTVGGTRLSNTSSTDTRCTSTSSIPMESVRNGSTAGK